MSHELLTPSYRSERMQICEDFPLDLWIFYRCIFLLTTIRSLRGMEIWGLWSSRKWALSDNFARHLFHLSLFRGIKEVSLLSQSEFSSCVDMYQGDIYPALVFTAILRVVSFSCPIFFWGICFGKGHRDMFKWSIEYGFMWELTLEAQKTVTGKWRRKNIYSIF